MGRLEGRVAVITGGASGMGLATVERFLEEGANVVVADFKEEEAGERLKADLGFGEDRLRYIRTDVSQEKDIIAMIDLATSAFGRLDIVHNNAGIGGTFGPFIETEVDHWDRTFAVMTRGVFLGVKHAARVMIEQGEGGSIINTASVAGLQGGSGGITYSATKAAVVSLTSNVALELAKHKIRVNCICPGLIFTPMATGGREEEMEERMKHIQPWPERGEGKHIASAALYLASDDSDFVTGTAQVVDGGHVAYGPNLIFEQNNLPEMRVAGLHFGTTGQKTELRKLDKK